MARCRCAGSDVLAVNPAVESRLLALESQVSALQAENVGLQSDVAALESLDLDAPWVKGAAFLTNVTGTATAAWKRIGPVCHLKGLFTGVVTANGTTTHVDLTLPFPAVDRTVTGAFGLALYVNTGISFASGFITTQGTLPVSTARLFTDGGAVPTTNIPFTWGTGDQIIWNMTYEVA